MMTYHVQFLLLVLAGWVNRQQQDVIDYQQEENRVLRAGLRGKRLSLSTEYVVHYHTERNHQGLGNELLTPLPASANDTGPIVSRERLGGILNYYCRAA